MAPVQTSYSERIAPNSPGTIGGSDFEVDTGLCETASPGIPFGRAVSQGTLSDQGVVLGGASDTAKFRGISAKTVTLGAEHDAYLPPDNVNVLHKGDIWVEPTHAVAANDPVYFTAATGALTNQSSGNLGPIKGARFKTTCGTGGRALVTLAGYNLAG